MKDLRQLKDVANVVAAASILLSASPVAADASSRGGVSLESRIFDPDGDETTEDFGVAVSSNMEVKYQSSPWSVVLRGFARLDALDETRNIADLQEGHVGFVSDRLTVRVGSQIINWSATEALHPADVLNSRNLDSNLDDLEKLGEPMVELRLRFLQGSIELYYMPVRITPNLVGSSSRLSLAPPGIEFGDILWLGRDGRPSDAFFAHQGAARITQTIGPADIAVHIVDHNDRHEPTFTIDPLTGEIRPTLHWMTQVGFTYVHVLGAMVLKLEGARRMFRRADDDALPGVTTIPDHNKAALGFEYNWTTSAGHEATVVAEAQAVLESREVRTQLGEIFQRDVLVGYRHFFNDVKARELFAGLAVDLETPNEYVAILRYDQRLTDVWSVGGSLHSIRILKRAIQQTQLSLTRNF
jgi:hypothetical protein